MSFKEKYNNLDPVGKWAFKGFGILLFIAIVITVIKVL